MGLRAGIFAGTVGIAILFASVLSALPVAADPAVSIEILFDFGDGMYVWAGETIADPSVFNATWLAVQRAAEANGITITTRWYGDELGVGISDLGGRHSPAGFVGLYEWNRTSHAWDLAGVGISNLVVSEGDAIALYNAGFDSVTFEARSPVPTPDAPLPTIEFRSDLDNSGTSVSPVPDAIQVRWDRNMGVREIAATPAVAYGRVFVTTLNGTFALDARTGEIVWTRPSAKGFSSPAVFDGSVIVGTRNGTVVRLNASDGAVRWETRLLTQTGFSGITSSPKVAFDRVFIGTFNESGGPGEVVSLWASNGTIAWRHESGSVHYSSPAYAPGFVYVGIMGTYNKTSGVTFDPPYGVLALDPATGARRWFYATSGSVAASPTIAGHRLIVPSKDGTVYAIDREPGTLAWQAAVDAGVSSAAVSGDTAFIGGGSFGGTGRVVALDVATGTHIKWSYTPNGPVQASITYADGRVVFSTNTDHGRVYALNSSTGSVLWSFEPTPAEYILGSPVVADGVVFAPSDNGHVYALEAKPPGGPEAGGALVTIVLLTAAVGVFGVALAVWVFVGRRSRRGP